jgi:Transcriptional regulators containing a DNA-binding HTH domain and an aminotransferase domain (MocR family) and their eukaryotic orthologs
MDYKFSDKMQKLKPSAIREIFKSLSDPQMISFAAGNPSPLSFPSKDLSEISAEIYADPASVTTALQYSITEGYPLLREALKNRMADKFSIGKDFDTTVVTSGGQQAIELACKVLCNEGEAVICENPSFIGALNAFRSCGVKPVGVELEDDGVNIDALEAAIKNTPKAKMIYLIPTFHNPAGITTSWEKRVKIYELAKKYSMPIFEDNPYGELRFSGEYVAPIKTIDTEGLVIYCSSFSKILSAGMRIGYVCAPDAIVQKMVVAKQSEDVHTNIFFQMLCYRYMTQKNMDAHIESIKELYGAKCGLMVKSIEEYFIDEIEFTRPGGGLFIWCKLPDSIPSSDFVKNAIAAKVAVVPGATFNCDETAPSQCFRLNYSTPSDEQIVSGIKALGDVARAMIKK